MKIYGEYSLSPQKTGQSAQYVRTVLFWFRLGKPEQYYIGGKANQPFTLPSATPRTMNLERQRYTITTGKIASAISR